MRCLARCCALAVALLLLGVTPDARGVFTLLDDFDNYTLGPLDDRSGAGPNFQQGGWIDNGAQGTLGTDPTVHLANVVVDPQVVFNQVLQIDANAAGGLTSVHKTLPTAIADGSTATVFMRFYVESISNVTGNLAIGASRAAAPGTTADYAGYGVAEGETKPGGTFRAGDGNTLSDLSPLYSPGAWNNLWVVLDNANDQVQFYTSRLLGQAPTLLTSANAPFDFQGGPNGQDLLTLMFQSSNNGPFAPMADAQYIDQIYIDTAGMNLTNPALNPGAFRGDYNFSKFVDQADLDLVLLNWGGTGIPNGWTRDFPVGIVDQSELDGVLLNWGKVVPSPDFPDGVPEPGALLVIAPVVIPWLSRRWAGTSVTTPRTPPRS